MVERTFYKKESKLYLACNDKKAFFTFADHYRGYHLWCCQNVYDALSFLLDNIYIRFGTKLYRQIVGIPMGTNCADLFLFCYERDFMKQRRGLDIYNVLHERWRSLVCQTTPLKI